MSKRRFGFALVFAVLAACLIAVPSMAAAEPHSGFANAFNADGDAYAQLPLLPGMSFSGQNNFTIELWIKPEAYGGTLYRQRGAGGQLQTWVVQDPNTGYMVFGLDHFGLGWSWLVTARPAPVGEWTHVAAVKDGFNTAIYFDGEVAATGTITGLQWIAAGCVGTPTIGRDFEGNQFHGQIDDARIFGAALDQATIDRWRFRSPDASHPNWANLMSYYRFDESSGTALTNQVSASTATVVSSQPPVFGDSTIGREYVTRQAEATTGVLPFYAGPPHAASAEVAVQAAHGTVVIDDADWGDFTYTPERAYYGPDTFSYRYTDTDGSSNTATVTIDVSEVDGVAPEASATVEPGQAWSGSDAATITLSASDNTTVEAIHYRIGAAAEQTYTAPFAVTAEGVTTVTYRATDVYGNDCAEQSVHARLDRTPPITSSNAQAFYFDSATVGFTTVDAGAGMGSTYAAVDGGGWVEGGQITVGGLGEHTVRFHSVDAVGNTEAEKTVTFIIGPSNRVFTRHGNDSRHWSAIDNSRRAYPKGADTVIVATGKTYQDAVAASSLAGVLDAPVLLTSGPSLNSLTAAEIRRLDPDHIVIVGGKVAVSSAVARSLKRLAPSVERIGGGDLYGTAELIARAVAKQRGQGYDGVVFVATGQDFQDALAASPIAAEKGWPILYVRSGKPMRTSITSAMKRMGVRRVYIVGGTRAVSVSAKGRIRSLTGANVVRIAGSNSFGTAAALARFAVDDAGMQWDGVGIASGTDWTCCVTAGPMLAQTDSPLLFSSRAVLPSVSRTELHAHRYEIRDVAVFGGSGSLLSAIEKQARAALE